MNKQKRKNSGKRRETKKRKRAVDRKAQVRFKSPDNMRTRHPLEYASTRKLSEVLLEFAEPLTNAVEGTEREAKAINMSITLWNASLLPKKKALEAMQPAIDDMVGSDQAIKSEFYRMFDMMYIRKQSYYSTDKRFVVDYSLEKNRDGFYLQVASTPFKS